MSAGADGTPDDWSEEQRRVFSRIYRHMGANQNLFTHPDAAPVDDDHWQTTCWNAAWFAADCTNPESGLWVHVDDDGKEIGAEVPPGRMN